MSGKKSTSTETSNINYNPLSMGIYQGFQPQIASTLSDYAQNPLQSTFFNQNLQMANKAAGQQGRAAIGNIYNNLRATGGTAINLSPFQQSMLASAGRGTSALKAGNFLNLLNQAQQARMWATGAMQGYSPLMTGQTSTGTSKTSGGLLPTIAGMAGSAALGMIPLPGMGSMPFNTGGAPSASPTITGMVPSGYSPTAFPLSAPRPNMPIMGPTNPWDPSVAATPNPFTSYPAFPLLQS